MKVGTHRVHSTDEGRSWWIERWNGEEWVAYSFRFKDRTTAEKFLEGRYR